MHFCGYSNHKNTQILNVRPKLSLQCDHKSESQNKIKTQDPTSLHYKTRPKFYFEIKYKTLIYLRNIPFWKSQSISIYWYEIL